MKANAFVTIICMIAMWYVFGVFNDGINNSTEMIRGLQDQVITLEERVAGLQMGYTPDEYVVPTKKPKFVKER